MVRANPRWVVEPVDPFEGCVFDGFEAAPWTATMDDFSLEEAVDRLGQGIVVTVTDAAYRGFNARLCQLFDVFDGQVLRAAVRMMDQPLALDWATFVDGLFEGIKHEPGMRGRC